MSWFTRKKTPAPVVTITVKSNFEEEAIKALTRLSERLAQPAFAAGGIVRPAKRSVGAVVNVGRASRSAMKNIIEAQDDARRRVLAQAAAQGFTGAVKLQLQVVATIEEGS